ncbi:MAG: NADP-dependent isocitrate dehydrogenase [Eubacteriales bacterium]|nr:NADP-dependent isocitrate dehydrogenase [Eubacteriales bacterium]
MQKIRMTTPLVEMDGDEMTRVLWQKIKDTLILPYVDLKTEYYDLGLKHRDETDDQVTEDSAIATQRLGVAVKCATITPNAQRVTEYNLKKMWKSPNGTIRAILDGTVFREPVLVKGITPCVVNWKKPIIIARHAYGDIYKNVEFRVPGKGVADLCYTDESGNETRLPIHHFNGAGVIRGMHNTDESIESFAHSCFRYALYVKQDLWFSTKDTISKTYDHHFKDVFNDLYENTYKADFEKAGITYFYTLIDDAVARVIRSEGGFIWALKNYDGDVMSDMLATAFSSLAMMTSVLVSPHGQFEYEAAHGTVTRHYYRYLKGEETSTNPVATIYAWTGALNKRGELDGLTDLCAFAKALEAATVATIESGKMTKDLIPLFQGEAQALNSDQFLTAIAETLQQSL